MECQNFVHQPLNQKTDEIRLLNILPSEDPTAPIECQILHVRLSQLPSYEALSYMWGNEDESQHILIRGEKYGVRENLSLAVKPLRWKDTMRRLWNKAPWYTWSEEDESQHLLIRGEKYGVRENLWLALKQLRWKDTMRRLWNKAPWYTWIEEDESENLSIRGKKYGVRENLWLALKQLRLERTTRCLWIDAICINQTDTAERNHQVDQMSLIFSQAARVVVWLGQSTEGSDDTLSFIARGRVDVALKSDDYPKQEFFKHWEEYVRLCERPYWARLWIIQEVALASRIVLCCGSFEVDWARFVRVDQMLRRWLAQFPQFNIEMDVFKTRSIPQRLSKIRLLDGRGLPRYERDPFLLDLLFEFNESQCKDIRDRIFGLLSLASKCCRDSMPVDYSKSPFDVCQSALRHHLQYHCPQEDTAAAMRLAYSTNSVLKEQDSTFRQARVIYTIPFSTTLPEYIYPTSALGSPSQQKRYFKYALRYMGYPAINENQRDIEATRMRNYWIGRLGEIQNPIHHLLCWYYGSPTRDGKPPTWSKKDTGELQIALDENGFMAVTNTNIQIGDRLFDKWSEKQKSQFRMDKDPIRDLSYFFLRTSKLGHTT